VLDDAAERGARRERQQITDLDSSSRTGSLISAYRAGAVGRGPGLPMALGCSRLAVAPVILLLACQLRPAQSLKPWWLGSSDKSHASGGPVLHSPPSDEAGHSGTRKTPSRMGRRLLHHRRSDCSVDLRCESRGQRSRGLEAFCRVSLTMALGCGMLVCAGQYGG